MKPSQKKKVIKKAWAILLQYKKDAPYIFQINTEKKATIWEYKNRQLYKPEYQVIPLEITFSLPKGLTNKKEKK